MGQVERIWRKIGKWTERVMEALLNPPKENEPELVPIPVKNHPPRGRQ
ncbi:MAG: hypothetical protein NZ901_02685 [Geminocystis sp.]|nr:hypothetical protein [Geminocystis sp.]HIK37936.1 hypothetical protein [Geminocystis sp. M7585_C2015_104]MCS7147078.1 hypothetical protein [Geminocystis sp.]MCX8079276.1 hypothetical protein [Geminocystis sp.]MDW8115901.1 hypothetical protein [Geminocystis sp.]